ncbi:MAG: aconitate hydratase AcnA [Candidatus Dadabacteria bacterium]|nr:aconitate hydratase AcnA [Candidatus Dadabacteria bacterium]MYA47641.1 aconitate hydratase AcnA [Candidatus Dadabacteria bacterium]MYG83174.1 aconitate hydratase AcnA [Candidatus Dadabacteria bacterium]MYK49741.1 aconitate hydratase AcnA [Candidatus Dadabacteria bacterium]
MALTNNLDALSDLSVGDKTYKIYSLTKLESRYGASISKLPFSIRILLENVLRNFDGETVTEQHVESLVNWDPSNAEAKEIPYNPARVILQDFTGVPCVVDLAAMRSVVEKKGGDPSLVNPIVPVDLVIDHSVQVDYFASGDAFGKNVEVEYERNRERYTFLKWAQGSFDNFRVVPPGTGIVHQVNLECLASVVVSKQVGSEQVAYPDTLVGTDSHTTMINGLSVMGWGVGGIEAEACMLGQPLYMLIPDVIGFRLTGRLSQGVTATDLVLTVTEMLRKKGVVGKFVEFFGPGVSNLTLSDQATIANMAPEYGATMGFFPVDAETLRYLGTTGRDDAATLVEAYTREQKMFRTDDAEDPVYTDTLELDISTVEPSLAGPSRPQDRISLGDMKSSYHENLQARGLATNGDASRAANGISDGSVVIAAITSCTNTSNPSVMVGAGLFAKKAVEKGLSVSPYVKTSLAPGSRVVTDYLDAAGLTPYLEELGFGLVGYGCTTCIGNSGPLPDDVDAAIRENDLTCAAVLSGNRNFEGRVHPLVKFAYLASPPLVVAFAIAGKVGIDLYSEPLGVGSDGDEVYLKDIWPTQQEIIDTVAESISPEIFNNQYSRVFEGDETWKSLEAPHSDIYEWDTESTYIQEPPFFDDFPLEPEDPEDIEGANVLALLGDSITTDHISPAGSIPKDGPAGGYLISKGVTPRSFNSFGSRRGNHEVMIRGSFANIRIRNKMVGGKEGGWTVHVPTGEEMSIYEASSRYMSDGTDLVVIGGKEYGTGSSRDWAAKGTALLGARCVIAESFERIHRSNLVGMGVLPLQFEEGESAESLGLTGFETFSISGISEDLYPGKRMTVTVTDPDGGQREFCATCRLDTPVEVEYYRNGGILQTVLRQMISG